MEQSPSGAEQIPVRPVKADSKVLAKHLQKLKSNKRISCQWLTFQDYRMLQETECFRVLQDFNSMPLMSTTAKIFDPIEKGNHYVTSAFEDDGWRKRTSICKEYTATRNREDSRPYASSDADQEIRPVLNIGFASRKICEQNS